MHTHQEVVYGVIRQGRHHQAVYIRAQRYLFISMAILLYLFFIGISVNALRSENHTWGVDAQPTGNTNGAWQITWSDHGLSADKNIQIGDQILAVNGQPPQSLAEINQADSLEILTATSRTPRMIVWQAPDPLDSLLSLSWIVLGAISILLGVLVFLHATARALALHFFLLWTAVALISSAEPATSFGNLLAVHLATCLSPVAIGLLASFLWLLLFPPPARIPPYASSNPERQHQGKPHWIREIPIVTGIFVAGYTLAGITLKQQDLVSQADLLIYGQTALGIVLSLAFILRASFARPGRITREQGRMLLGGMMLGVLPLLLLTVLPLLVVKQTVIPGQVSALALIALPLSFGYAIVRRDLLRVDSLIRNTVLTLLTIIGMAIAAVFFAVVLNPFPAIPALVMGIIAGALLAPLMLKAARWITEAWLFPQVRRYRKLIASGERIERTGLDPQRLAGQLIGEVHLALPVRQVAVFVPEKHTGQLVALPVVPADANVEERAGGPITSRSSSPLQSAREKQPRYQPLLLDETASARLSRARASVLIGPSLENDGGDSGSAQESEPSDSDIELWHLLIPMRVQGRLVGVLALSRREDDQDYSDTDLKLLRVLAGRRTLALDYSLLYSDLHAAYEQRRELDAAKDRFIVTAHHELRTPLTGVLGYLELMRELGPEGREARPKDVDIFLNNACRSAEELTAQLESMLTAAEASFTPQEIQLHPVRIGAVVQRAIHTLEGQARAGSHRVQSRIPEELLALADEEALYRILLNLLSNALKYSAENRPVIFGTELPNEVSEEQIVWVIPPARHYPVVNVIVRDWGNGIPRKQQPMIFERFTRLDHDLNSPVRGTGLGLSICYQLAVSMGGGLGVWSEGITGKGSLFVVQLAGVEMAQEPTAQSFGDIRI